jgi:hypothetical protein
MIAMCRRKNSHIRNYYFACSVTLRGKHRLLLFENCVVRHIFGPKREEVMVDRRKLHNAEGYDLHSSQTVQ